MLKLYNKIRGLTNPFTPVRKPFHDFFRTGNHLQKSVYGLGVRAKIDCRGLRCCD